MSGLYVNYINAPGLIGYQLCEKNTTISRS